MNRQQKKEVTTMTKTERTYERVQQDLNALAELLREQDFIKYLSTPQDKCYNSAPLLNALQKAQNSVEDLKQFVMGW